MILKIRVKRLAVSRLLLRLFFTSDERPQHLDRCAGVYGRCCKYKIDIAYNFRSLQSGFAGAKILDYYKSVITGSSRSKALVISRTGRIAFMIVNEPHWLSYFASRFSIAHTAKISSEVGYGNEPRISAPGASIIADLATPLICSLRVSVPFVDFSW